MDSLQFNETWHFVDLPSSCKQIGCKWVSKKKLKLDETVDKYNVVLIVNIGLFSL